MSVSNPVYDEYLRSPWWKSRRLRCLKQAGYRCKDCGGRANQVHHLSYAHLGAELDRDLVALCKDCHETRHQILEAEEKERQRQQRKQRKRQRRPRQHQKRKQVSECEPGLTKSEQRALDRGAGWWAWRPKNAA